MADRLGIKIALDFDNESVAQGKLDSLLKKLQENSKLNINVDQNSIKNLEIQLAQLKSKISKDSTSVKLFTKDSLNNRELISGIDEVIAKYKSIGNVTFTSKTFDPATKDLIGFTAQVEKADGVIQKLKYKLGNILNQDGTDEKKFINIDLTEIDKTAEIAEKVAQKTQQINKQIADDAIKQQERIQKLGEFKGNFDPSLLNKTNEEIKEFVQNMYGGDAKVVGFKKSVDGANNSIIKMTVNTKTNKNEIQQETVTLDKNTSSIYKNGEAIKRNDNHMVGWLDRLKNATVAVTSFFTVTSSFYAVVNSIQNGIQSVISLDDSMVGLRKVTNESEEAYKSFMVTANQTAISVGHTTQAAIDATTEFSRLGYSLQEASELGKTALIYSNIGDIGIDEATKSIISTYKAYGDQIKDVTQIIDVANEVGNNWAITTGGIGDALQRSASALSEANNSYEQSVALLTAANSSIQDTNKVGTALFGGLVA